jgi:hypothetical protein
MGNCVGSNSEKQPLIKKIGGHKKNEGGGVLQEDIEGEAWTDVPKRSCVILPGSTYACPWDVIFWRIALFVTMSLITTWSIYAHSQGTDDDHPDTPLKKTDAYFWFIYLTHWGLMVQTLYFIMALCTLLAAVVAQEPDFKRVDNEKPWYMSLTFGLQAIVLPVSCLITVAYWTIVFNPKTDTVKPLSLATHGGQFVLALVDFILGQQPLFCAKVLYPIFFCLSYAVFTAIYYYNGGETESGERYIYKVTDYANAPAVIEFFAGFTGALIVVYYMFYGVYRFIKRYCGPPPLKG